MPIVGYNPDGTVRIARKSGKDVKNVKPEELKDYNALLEKEYNDTFNSAQSVASGDLKLTDLPSDRRETISTLVRTNPKIKADVKNDLAEKAQSVLDVIQQGKEGKLKGEAYKDALNVVSSSFLAAKGFGQGGKALTQPELAVLSGQTPNISSREQSWIDKLTGYVPPVKSEVKDDEKTLERKMKIAIKIARGEKITPEDAMVEGGGQPEGLNIGGDVKNIINNLLGAPGQAIQRGQQVGQEMAQSKNFTEAMQKSQQLQPNNLIFEMLKGYGQNLYKDVGSPLEGGDIVGRAGQNFQERPVSTVLDLLPFLGGAKNLIKGKVPTGGDILPKNPFKDITGRAATSIVAPEMSSVARSEELMGKALQITKAKTSRGMAKELETEVIPRETSKIRTWVANKDKQIGNQPLEEVRSQIMQRVSQSAEAKTNPQLVKQFATELNSLLDEGFFQEGANKGAIGATNFNRMNETRIKFNNDLKRWYAAGKPTGNPANDYNAMRYEAGNAIKEIIAEADESGIVNQALDNQHVAFETVPALSKEALTTTKGGLFQRMFSAVGDLTSPARISGARAFQGKQALPEQSVSGQSAQLSYPAVENTEFFKSIMPNYKGKKTSGTKFIRDKRKKVGNPGAFREK